MDTWDEQWKANRALLKPLFTAQKCQCCPKLTTTYKEVLTHTGFTAFFADCQDMCAAMINSSVPVCDRVREFIRVAVKWKHYLMDEKNCVVRKLMCILAHKLVQFALEMDKYQLQGQEFEFCNYKIPRVVPAHYPRCDLAPTVKHLRRLAAEYKQLPPWLLHIKWLLQCKVPADVAQLILPYVTYVL